MRAAWIGLAVVLALGFGQTARAADAKGHPDLFQKLDANHDGKITQNEIPKDAPERLKAALEKADANHDKVVTQDEWQAAVKKFRESREKEASEHRAKEGSEHGAKGPESGKGPAAGNWFDRIFNHLDTNHDGVISKDELKSALERWHHARAEKEGCCHRHHHHHGWCHHRHHRHHGWGHHHHHGRHGCCHRGDDGGKSCGRGDASACPVKPGECAKSACPAKAGEGSKSAGAGEKKATAAAPAKSAEAAKPAAAKAAAPAKPAEAKAAAPARPAPGERFKMADKNGDGKLSRDEVKGGPLAENFDKIDANHDGQLTQDEIRKWFVESRKTHDATKATPAAQGAKKP